METLETILLPESKGKDTLARKKSSKPHTKSLGECQRKSCRKPYSFIYLNIRSSRKYIYCNRHRTEFLMYNKSNILIFEIEVVCLEDL